MEQPACSLDLAMPCRDAVGTEHRSAAPVPPITWRFAPAADGAHNTSRQVQKVLLYLPHACFEHALQQICFCGVHELQARTDALP